MEIRLSSVLLASALLSGCGWFHRGEKAPAMVVVDEPQAEPSIIDMQCAWPLPISMSSSQMFSVRRSQSSCA